ncbi:helix-turn-helix transcriptional regulator [Aquabacterium sp.]|uniref:helix-turn-helix transcriptional regulator n=1 Tax=Aquabacterium sp. TaxID=1872578 RepID=UPI0035AEB897
MGSKTERFYKIELMIRNRGQVSFEEMLTELEVSRATLKRDLQFLRDRLGAPIVYHRDDNAYRLNEGDQGDKHELPGMWFDERELYAMLMAHQLLSQLDQDGTLSRHMAPLLDRIYQLLGTDATPSKDVMRRVRIISPARRAVPGVVFETVAAALLARKRLHLQYFTRSRKKATERVVSPQRLIHYRNTWYLDAWCHESDELRRFALDAMEQATLLDTKAKDLSLKRVEQELDGGYGIFAGNQVKWATLQFSADVAQWVQREEWHPEQRLTPQPDGSLKMELPFVDQTELVMDLMRFGPDVKVVSPAGLRQAVVDRLTQAQAQYAKRA